MTINVELPECIHGLLAVSCSLCATPAHREHALIDEVMAAQRTHVLRSDLAAALLERSRQRDAAYLHRERTVPVQVVPVSLSGIPDNLVDQVTELCERTSQPTSYSTWEMRDGERVLVPKTWRSVEDSLIVQLQRAADSTGAETGGSTFGSRPPTRVEAMDCLRDIRVGVTRELNKRDLEQKTITADLLKLRSIAPRLDACDRRRGTDGCCPRHDLERQVRHWWVQARIVTGWDSPAWAPNATCPVCEHRGSLRIRLNPDTAMCRECRTTWDRDDIGLLAEHIRTENHDTTQEGSDV